MASDIAAKIKTRGYFEVSIRPVEYREGRVAYLDLFEFVRSRSVAFRGWDFPHVADRQETRLLNGHIRQDHQWHHHVESWAMFGSGLFVALRGYAQDWRDESLVWPPDPSPQHSLTMNAIEVFYRMVEVFEFADRLTADLLPAGRLKVEMSDHGLKGRALVNSMGYLDRIGGGISSLDSKAQSIEMTRAELVSDPLSPAVTFTRDLCAIYGSDVPADLLRESARKLKRRTIP